ncbi:MAG: hypothetical protein JST86_09465 [Bacteroidetes bacterium]|nr:hypothetical protein [Bacteroidota bacterium]
MKTIGTWLLKLLKSLLAFLFGIILFIIGWTFKMVSRVLDKIGDEIIGFKVK